MTTDYTTYPLVYRMKKVLRYQTMYGLSRTLEKVRGQYHMKNDGPALESDWINQARKYKQAGSIGILGCGNFAFSTIGYYCHKLKRGEIRGAYDPVGSRAISLIKRYGGAYAAASASSLIRDPNIRLIFVASNHASHAEYAIEAISAGKSVHIEKPHVVNRDQLRRLVAAIKANPSDPVFLGFNRPRSEHFKQLKEVLAKESGPLMINWFLAGHALDPGHWYFSEAEGGRILGNLCHWSDLTLHMVGLEKAFPIEIRTAASPHSSSDFGILLSFAEGSVGVISFSAKGETFEGVREYLNVHKGNALCSLQDFERVSFDVIEKNWTFSTRRRDHGHMAAVAASLAQTEPVPLSHLAETANLFLGIKESVDSRLPVRLERVT